LRRRCAAIAAPPPSRRCRQAAAAAAPPPQQRTADREPALASVGVRAPIAGAVRGTGIARRRGDRAPSRGSCAAAGIAPPPVSSCGLVGFSGWSPRNAMALRMPPFWPF
jgi:hypothetical protein